MKTKMKWIVGLGITFTVLAIGGGVWYFVSSKKSKTEGGDKEPEKGGNTEPNNTGSGTNTGGGNGNTGGGTGSVTVGAPSNTAEGNAFRAWVNTKYPAYAESIDLDPTGSYNNSYIATAYAKYGAEYNKLIHPTITTSSATGKGVYSVSKGAGIYLAAPNMGADKNANPIITGTKVRVTDSANQKLGTFVKYVDIHTQPFIAFKDANSGKNVLILKASANIK